MKLRGVFIRVITILGGVLLIWLMFFSHIERFEVGITWNVISGEVTLQEPGLHFTSPVTLVSVVDTRPQRVCITSGSHAAFSCKLVRFRVDEWKTFIATEGWRYYWLSNRISLNTGYREEYRGFRDVLRGYAFSDRRYPFIEVLESSQ